jgi:hypothetical protein
MKKIISAFLFWVTLGCNNTNSKTSTADSVITTTQNNADTAALHNPANIDVSGCYMQVLKKDTFAASLQQQGNMVTGRLTFNNYEKDASTGTVTGKLDGDWLKLVYAFSSEGMNSVMDVYFKYQDGNLLRGIGEMNNRGDTMYFANPGSVKFDGDRLMKISCSLLPVKYKN